MPATHRLADPPERGPSVLQTQRGELDADFETFPQISGVPSQAAGR